MKKLYKAKMHMVFEAESAKALKAEIAKYAPSTVRLIKDSIEEVSNIQQLPEGITKESHYSILDTWENEIGASGMNIGEWFEENSPERVKKEKQQELREMKKEVARIQKELNDLG